MRVTSSAEVVVFPSHSVGASTKIATTASAKCFIPMGSVRRNAIAHKMER